MKRAENRVKNDRDAGSVRAGSVTVVSRFVGN
jgi:hypothetical protein